MFPPFPKCADSHRGVWLALDVLDFEQFIFPPKRKKVRKERVEVRLGAEVQDLSKVSMVDVCKDTEELAINVLYGGRKRRIEYLVCEFDDQKG